MMIEKRRKNNRKRSGFTLAETLITVLILLMVSTVVAAGIPAASNAYVKVVDASNEEVLLSTTMSALRNELSMATDVVVVVSSDGKSKSVTYYNSSRGSYSVISFTNEGVMLTRYAAPPSNEGTAQSAVPTGIQTTTEEPLTYVKAANSSDKLIVTCGEITISEDGKVLTFSDMKAASQNGTDFSVRLMVDKAVKVVKEVKEVKEEGQ